MMIMMMMIVIMIVENGDDDDDRYDDDDDRYDDDDDTIPVLSEHILVAFPIVSQAANTRMRLLSNIIFCVE